ncbi:MAG: hypothetical protein JO184_10975 [Gammaproteobacteria bacterium]|nr:hypothetical protein [Gammaproteobacteria bacterium]
MAEYLAADSSRDGVPQGLAQLLYRHTEGNPLFMVAALDHLTQRGLIARENGTWQLKVPLGEVDLGVPETLRQMIEAQIDRLSQLERLALEAASVQGTEFSSTICAEVIDGDAEEYEALYDSMARQRRVVRAVGSHQLPGRPVLVRCAFVHALYREVLYSRQPLRRRATLHQRIGEQLEALYSKRLDEVASELAGHFEESGDWPRAIKYLRLAAEAAEPRRGHSETVTLLERALSLTSKLPAEHRPLTEIEILEAFESILYMHMVLSPARFEELASYASQCGVIEVEVRALIQTARFWGWHDSGRALELLDRADRISAQQTDSLAVASARLMIIVNRAFFGRASTTDASECRTAILKLRNAGRLTGRQLVLYSLVLLTSSEYREARRSALEGLALLTGQSAENPCADMMQVTVAYVLFNAAVRLGEWGEALRLTEATVVTLTKNANDVYAVGVSLWRALLSVVAMDFETTLAICDAAARAFGGPSYPIAKHQHLAVMATAEVALGRHERGLELLSLAAHHDMSRQPAAQEYNFLIEWTQTELWLGKGNLAQASVQGERLLERALGTLDRSSHALAWEANARVAMAKSDLGHAEQCIVKASAAMEGFEIPQAAWRVHATAAALFDRIGNVESAERHRELSRATILKIADSLAPEEPLRKAFLSAVPVAEVLGSAGDQGFVETGQPAAPLLG